MTKRPKTRAGTQGGRKKTEDAYAQMVTELADELETGAPARKLPPTPPRPKVPFPDRTASRAPSDVRADDLVVDAQDLPEIPKLAIAVHDTTLASATLAITACGHAVVATGMPAVRDAIQDDVDVILVGLPGGEPLIDAALALAPRRPVVIAAWTGDALEAVRRAAAAGADLVTLRPYDPERLAPVLLAAARLADMRSAATNARGSEAVLRARLDALVEPEPGTLQAFELFQRVLELELKRARRYRYPIAVALFTVELAPPDPPAGIRGILRARAGNALVHAIRDIDLATELDHDRFLVLLPYTDVDGAAEVARRIIAAVGDNAPVVAAGRTFPVRLVGAVASGAPGQQLSFAKLMRDATQALDQARSQGIDLLVPE